jgi:hypothetical protein
MLTDSTQVQKPGEETQDFCRRAGCADRSIENLGFRVPAAQNAREALSQMQSVTRLVWLMTLMSLAMVTLAIAYFALNRRVRYEDISRSVGVRPPDAENEAAPK